MVGRKGGTTGWCEGWTLSLESSGEMSRGVEPKKTTVPKSSTATLTNSDTMEMRFLHAMIMRSEVKMTFSTDGQIVMSFMIVCIRAPADSCCSARCSS